MTVHSRNPNEDQEEPMESAKRFSTLDSFLFDDVINQNVPFMCPFAIEIEENAARRRLVSGDETNTG